uniref:Acyltransferase 3 domain-containing protein n=1 Tax=Mucochytrium quahogii TaxID=96639 RepID=A0A7S2WNE1_9STRA|mmetsp:Transcript_5376/g.11919  ORF Transcript_5376/g.11919 Transcript_5376/m.11919 type:complete len:534 (+) Transcript_5376:1378-2979(+)
MGWNQAFLDDDLVTFFTRKLTAWPLIATTCYVVAQWIYLTVHDVEPKHVQLSLKVQIVMGVLFMAQQCSLYMFSAGLQKWNGAFAIAWVVVYFCAICIQVKIGKPEENENEGSIKVPTDSISYEAEPNSEHIKSCPSGAKSPQADAKPGFKDLENLDKILAEKKLEPYIFNLKVFITFMVIFSHAYFGMRFPSMDPIDWDFGFVSFGLGGTLIAMPTGISAMNIFMLLSGYFTPKSVKSRGVTKFLVERTKRLGIPLTFTWYIWYPYVELPTIHAVGVVANEDMPPVGDAGVGVAWFVLVLWWFSVIFVACFGDSFNIKMKLPNFGWSYLVMGILGVLSGLLYVYLGNVSYFNVPSCPLFLLGYAAFFFFGTLAGHGAWFEELVKVPGVIRVVIYVSTVGFFAMAELFALQSGMFSTTMDLFHGLNETVAKLLLGLFMYWGALSAALALVLFFHDYCNWTNKLSPFFWASAYTAYLIQKPFVYFALYVASIASGPESSNATGYYYFIVIVPLTLLIWPVAFGIRTIPGFSKVL